MSDQEKPFFELLKNGDIKEEIECFKKKYEKQGTNHKSLETYEKQTKKLKVNIDIKKLKSLDEKYIKEALQEVNKYFSTRTSHNNMEKLATIIINTEGLSKLPEKLETKKDYSYCVNIIQKVIDSNKEKIEKENKEKIKKEDKMKLCYSLITKFFSVHYNKKLPIMDNLVKQNLLGLDGDYFIG